MYDFVQFMLWGFLIDTSFWPTNDDNMRGERWAQAEMK